MLAASSRLLLWASDPKREGARLVGSAPGGISAVGILYYLSWWDASVLIMDDKTIMLDSIWSTYDALQMPDGRVIRSFAWPAAFCSSRIALLSAREQTEYYALQNN